MYFINRVLCTIFMEFYVQGQWNGMYIVDLSF